MVIAGEKAPAFSATTLLLPPPQIDNTAKIIENTRRKYSRTRADVEQEISLAIQPPEHLQSKRPQSASQARQWPINAQSQTVTPTPVPEQGTAPATAAFGSDPIKKKRTRTRKRKTSPQTEEGSHTAPATEQQNPTELKLR